MIKAEWRALDASVSYDAPYHPSIGSYNNTIYYFQANIFMKCNIHNNSVRITTSFSSLFTHGYSQYWTQIGHTLFMIAGSSSNISEQTYASYINAYILSTKSFEFEEKWNNITIPTYVGLYGCLASTSDSLYVVGGVNNGVENAFQILDLSTNTWKYGPIMIESRRYFACIVSPSNNNLYAIGGIDGIVNKDTIEHISVIDVEHKRWQYINNNLDEGLIGGRVVSYGIYIYYIGGYVNGKIKKVRVIDTSTNMVSTSTDLLLFDTAFSAPIIVDNVLYSFGGTSTVDKQFQYYKLSTLMPAPTEFPITDEAYASTSNTYKDGKVNEDDNDIEPKGTVGSSDNELSFDIPIIIAIICVCVCCIAVICVFAKKKKNETKRTVDTMETVIRVTNHEPAARAHIKVDNDDYDKIMVKKHVIKEDRQRKTPGIHPDIKDDEFIVDGDEVTATDYGIMDETHLWLKSMNLSVYYEHFIVNGYDSMNFIKEIKEINELSEIGISNQKHQMILMKAISQLSDERAIVEGNVDDKTKVNDGDSNCNPHQHEGATLDGSFGKCTDCNRMEMGKIYDVDGLFYCLECWKQYDEYAVSTVFIR